MKPDFQEDYSLFFRFLESYSPNDFQGINPSDPLLSELEELMEQNNQFFYVGDVLKMQILYTSKRSTQILGIKPEELNFYHFYEATHPIETQRLSYGRAKLIKQSQQIYIAEKGSALLSTNFHLRTPQGGFCNYLMQNYLFYSGTPHKTVYLLKIHTNIDGFNKVKYGYHYYTGNDLSYFRYPDEALLMMGNVFSAREFEIVKLISDCMNSDQIAEKLHLSIHTVNTHRRNILEKTGKAHISELIYDLQERGVL